MDFIFTINFTIMRTYQYKYNEIFIFHSYEDRFAGAYNELFSQLLLSKNISAKRTFELLNIHNNKITSLPHVVRDLLQREQLPAFKFLICKN
jgi:hypothetical protein